MSIGRFFAGIAAVIYSPNSNQYLLLKRSEYKDYAPGAWECVTGRVDQGEGFEDALQREVREELGVRVQVEHILGTTHFHRGAPIPENELVGVIYLCTLTEPASVQMSAEHSEYRWLSAHEACAAYAADRHAVGQAGDSAGESHQELLGRIDKISERIRLRAGIKPSVNISVRPQRSRLPICLIVPGIPRTSG
jgi:8-oxo-dGTP diphosphatase